MREIIQGIFVGSNRPCEVQSKGNCLFYKVYHVCDLTGPVVQSKVM